ncbi:MerR family transcriptional regulator [Mycobacterium sp.]|uniref:MerR family transcriptional regulator n=1 Tax=Mycobacterium sp. TaxID=1785 RepID=UPI0025D2F6C5|nr:MerR family transcriptional regulator [Mycobacterium sp.]
MSRLDQRVKGRRRRRDLSAGALKEQVQPRYTVRAAAQRIGVPTATLRSWSHRYGVGPLSHAPGQHRLYTDTDIAALRHMSRLIAKGVDARSAANTAMQALVPAPTQTAALLTALFALEELTAARLIDRHLGHYGVLETWRSLIRPVFAEISSQQAGGDRCIDVEHLLSWTVMSCLQRIPMSPNNTAETVLLACAANDRHTLALEAVRAALCERGHTALMLGAAVPTAAILDAIERRAELVTVLLWAQTERTAEVAAVRALRKARPQPRVLVAGPGWEALRLPTAVAYLHSLDEAVERLAAPVSS